MFKRISIQQEIQFQKRNIIEKKARYLATNPLERYNTDAGYRRKIDLIQNQLSLEPRGLILDVGGNTAGEATILQNLGYEFVVGDINEYALVISRERAQKYGLRTPRYVSLDAHALPFPKDTFEQVTVIEALHHFPDYAQALDEVFRVLKPGGRFFSLEPYRLNPIRRLTEIRDYWRGTIETSFSVAQMRGLLSASTFESISIEKISLGKTDWKLGEVPGYRRWFARFNRWLNVKCPAAFGSLMITAQKPADAASL